MSTRILSIALLLLFVCTAYSRNGRFPSRTFARPCCTNITTGNITDRVTGNTYRQMPARPGSTCVPAILLKTHHGEVCVDPTSEWVKNLTANMKKV